MKKRIVSSNEKNRLESQMIRVMDKLGELSDEISKLPPPSYRAFVTTTGLDKKKISDAFDRLKHYQEWMIKESGLDHKYRI